MAQTKINASQTTITASDIGAAGAVTTLPTASASEEGKIYQFTGTTTASYTNGYFYKCVSDGAVTPTYSWTQVNVQPAGSSLPSQTGNAGKFLTTDGTDASWSDKPLVNTATGSYSVTVGSAWGTASTMATSVGSGSDASGDCSTAVGFESYVISGKSHGLCIGAQSYVGAIGAMQFGKGSNNEAGTVYYGLTTNGTTFTNYKLLDSDGTIPADRLKNAINKYSTMPTAASTNEGWIVQYTGTTDSTYTHGYLYECVSDGATPTPNYSWTAVQLGGGSSYTAGTGITISGGAISVTTPVTEDGGTLTAGTTTLSESGNWRTRFGRGGRADGNGATAFGNGAMAAATYATAIGAGCAANASRSIQLGSGTNNDANTFKVGNNNGNFEMMSADGTIPKERLTKIVSTPSTMPTLAVADWSSDTQTVNVTGVTATNTVFVSPAPASAADYASAGIICTAQGAGTLTFTCTTTPTNAITVNVVILG